MKKCHIIVLLIAGVHENNEQATILAMLHLNVSAILHRIGEDKFVLPRKCTRKCVSSQVHLMSHGNSFHVTLMKMNSMTYGLFQYYHDELTNWNRVVEFHKQESGELVRQVTVVLDQQLNSPANEKESSGYIDQFMVQQQEFDHVLNTIISQLQRLEKLISSPGNLLQNPIISKQASLRSQMQRIERNFSRTKYSCAIFISGFLTDQVPVPLTLKPRSFALKN